MAEQLNIKLLSYLGRHRLTKATNESMTGTSTSTPTTAAKAAPEFRPNKAMATATANSKKFEVPIKQAGPAMSCRNFIFFAAHQVIKNMP
jgi:hypothetical protein